MIKNIEDNRMLSLSRFLDYTIPDLLSTDQYTEQDTSFPDQFSKIDPSRNVSENSQLAMESLINNLIFRGKLLN